MQPLPDYLNWDLQIRKIAQPKSAIRANDWIYVRDERLSDDVTRRGRKHRLQLLQFRLVRAGRRNFLKCDQPDSHKFWKRHHQKFVS